MSEIFQEALEKGKLPPDPRTDDIVVLPKLDTDGTQCDDFQPILLLNTEICDLAGQEVYNQKEIDTALLHYYRELYFMNITVHESDVMSYITDSFPLILEPTVTDRLGANITAQKVIRKEESRGVHRVPILPAWDAVLVASTWDAVLVASAWDTVLVASVWDAVLVASAWDAVLVASAWDAVLVASTWDAVLVASALDAVLVAYAWDAVLAACTRLDVEGRIVAEEVPSEMSSLHAAVVPDPAAAS
ncbi:hypothetical protein NDU88_006778 [Pleurodeles waltl]|uniref:Uncharacterized protein n=1 Tax=Pleurodeles waltl TaxID=8319 RepID=A0AAV7MKY0_PLEWA|nr:hypothetical protein NDU88_006778 [Pleurodeles waltl]